MKDAGKATAVASQATGTPRTRDLATFPSASLRLWRAFCGMVQRGRSRPFTFPTEHCIHSSHGRSADDFLPGDRSDDRRPLRAANCFHPRPVGSPSGPSTAACWACWAKRPRPPRTSIPCRSMPSAPAAIRRATATPSMQLEPDDVAESLERLRHIGAVGMVEGYGRVTKYRHYLYEWLGVEKLELSVMIELLLRGADRRANCAAGSRGWTPSPICPRCAPAAGVAPGQRGW